MKLIEELMLDPLARPSKREWQPTPEHPAVYSSREMFPVDPFDRSKGERPSAIIRVLAVEKV